MREVPSARRVVRALFVGAALLAGPGLAACSSDGDATLANVPENLIVDPFLWQGALDALGFQTVAVADPATGRIETAWSVIRSGGPEVRAIVQIYPGDLSTNSVAVEVHTRRGGVEMGNDAAAAAGVHEAILLRARQLRASIDN